ncbi:unnamed protein product, partial [Cyprideis torosa]
MWHSSKAPIEAHNWAESRPQSSTSGDGVSLDASDNFQWIDLSSGTDLPFLCEIPSNTRPVALKCPDGFFSLELSCYAVYDDKRTMTWDDAQTFCASRAAGGRLVELETAGELGRVKDHLIESDYVCGGYWIGAEEIASTNMYSWSSTGQLVDFYDWWSDQPDHPARGDAIDLYCPANCEYSPSALVSLPLRLSQRVN